jgi:hypothetical protein
MLHNKKRNIKYGAYGYCKKTKCQEVCEIHERKEREEYRKQMKHNQHLDRLQGFVEAGEDVFQLQDDYGVTNLVRVPAMQNTILNLDGEQVGEVRFWEDTVDEVCDSYKAGEMVLDPETYTEVEEYVLFESAMERGLVNMTDNAPKSKEVNPHMKGTKHQQVVFREYRVGNLGELYKSRWVKQFDAKTRTFV